QNAPYLLPLLVERECNFEGDPFLDLNRCFVLPITPETPERRKPETRYSAQLRESVWERVKVGLPLLCDPFRDARRQAAYSQLFQALRKPRHALAPLSVLGGPKIGRAHV